MIQVATHDYAELSADATLTIKRVLPGPIDRVWAYLSQSELRRQWLAGGGDMPARAGSAFELVWRNDELTDPAGAKPDGFGDEHRLASEIVECDPPRVLAFTWGETGGVRFELEPAGDEVMLTLTHRRIVDRGTQLNVSAGWHAHLDVLQARLANREPQPFWDNWVALKSDYRRRLSA